MQTGDVRFAGAHATRTFLRRWVGYVEQFDTLVPNLTPFEMLMYTAVGSIDAIALGRGWLGPGVAHSSLLLHVHRLFPDRPP